MTYGGVDYRDRARTAEPSASDAWIAPDGGFYPVDDFGHSALARSLVLRVMRAIPQDRHLGCLYGTCSGGDVYRDSVVVRSYGIALDHDHYGADPVDALEAAGWAHCSLGTIYSIRALTPAQVDTAFDMLMAWRRQYGEGHMTYGARIAAYAYSLAEALDGR